MAIRGGKANVKKFGFQAIRHLTTSILFNAGYGVDVIQLILRHKSPNTPERYLRNFGLDKARTVLEELSQERVKIIAFKSENINILVKKKPAQNKKPIKEPLLFNQLILKRLIT